MSGRIGEALVAAGVITADQLASALEAQQREGGYLGLHLILAGALTRQELFRALAEQWGTETRDLLANPPDPDLASLVHVDEMSELAWIPVAHLPGGGYLIGTAVRPTEELLGELVARFGPVPIDFVACTNWDLFRAAEVANRSELLYLAQDRLAEEEPDHSARRGLTRVQLWTPIVLTTVVVIGALMNFRLAAVVVLSVTNVVFLLSILFKAIASIRAPLVEAVRHRRATLVSRERVRRGLSPTWDVHVDDRDLPIYTVLVPAFREANIIDKLIRNLGEIDYPRSRLDVIVLMEENDTETVDAAKRVSPPEFVRLLVVPAGEPQTKPRACNYGLAFARGKYVVIYDAEDRPESLQLRKAVAAFEQDRFEREYLGSTRPQLACVQAELYYFNADYNVLTRMFAIEYAHWFTAMLPGMDGTGVPLPLGGTSNHFDVEVLREAGAWDPYNVTEDADLGLRISVKGYRVDVLSSRTGEEACAAVSAWIPQRTRWIKGYMVTAAVNLRHPIQFARRVGPMGVIGMVGLILGTPLTFLAYPLVLGFTIVTYIGVQFIGLNLPGWVVASSVATAIGGNLLMIVASGIAAARRYSWRIGMFAIFNPIYWCLHSVAAWRALYQTIFSPHHWEKTPHGISEDYESTAHL